MSYTKQFTHNQMVIINQLTTQLPATSRFNPRSVLSGTAEMNIWGPACLRYAELTQERVFTGKAPNMDVTVEVNVTVDKKSMMAFKGFGLTAEFQAQLEKLPPALRYEQLVRATINCINNYSSKATTRFMEAMGVMENAVAQIITMRLKKAAAESNQQPNTDQVGAA
jgi:hypothetical protein